MVAATQNPIEQEGTYPLPEAQLDRFLLKLMVDYPSPTMELAILQLNASGEQLGAAPVTLSQTSLQRARSEVLAVTMQSRLEHYLVELVCATRPGSGLCPALEPLIVVGQAPAPHLGWLAPPAPEPGLPDEIMCCRKISSCKPIRCCATALFPAIRHWPTIWITIS